MWITTLDKNNGFAILIMSGTESIEPPKVRDLFLGLSFFVKIRYNTHRGARGCLMVRNPCLTLG